MVWPGNVGELRDVLELSLDRASSKKVRIEHLRIPNADALLAGIRQMDEDDAEGKVLQYLIDLFGRQGLTKGKGLQGRLAKLLRRSESTVSRALSRFCQ